LRAAISSPLKLRPAKPKFFLFAKSGKGECEPRAFVVGGKNLDFRLNKNGFDDFVGRGAVCLYKETFCILAMKIFSKINGLFYGKFFNHILYVIG
jgi:hypothetical protein